jgi:hypothetical protein
VRVSDGTRTRDRLDHNQGLARADSSLNAAWEAEFVQVAVKGRSSISRSIRGDTRRFRPQFQSLGPARVTAPQPRRCPKRVQLSFRNESAAAKVGGGRPPPRHPSSPPRGGLGAQEGTIAGTRRICRRRRTPLRADGANGPASPVACLGACERRAELRELLLGERLFDHGEELALLEADMALEPLAELAQHRRVRIRVGFEVLAAAT